MPIRPVSGGSGTSLAGLAVDLARAYRGWLVIILLARLVETRAADSADRMTLA